MGKVLKPYGKATDFSFGQPGSTAGTQHFSVKQKLRCSMLAKRAITTAQAGGKRLTIDTPLFADIDCSARYFKASGRVLHTFIATRGRAGGPWICARGRRTDVYEELPWVQGFHPRQLDFEGAGITRSQAGGMLGNAMSLNVVERLLCEAFWCAGLSSKRPVDRWANQSVPIGPHP